MSTVAIDFSGFVVGEAISQTPFNLGHLITPKTLTNWEKFKGKCQQQSVGELAYED